MNNKIKYTLIGLGILATGAIAFFAVRYYKLKKAYSTVLTENEAINVIKDRFDEIDESEIDYSEADKEFGVIDKQDKTGVVLGDEDRVNEFIELCEENPELCEEIIYND